MLTANKGRKTAHHNKVRQIEDQDGWTHVVRGPRPPSTELNRSGQRYDERKRLHQDHGIQNFPFGALSIEEIRSKYLRTRKIWAEEPLRTKFEDVFSTYISSTSEAGIVIDNVLVLGLGSVATDNMSSNSMYQLALLEYWIAFLRSRFTIRAVHFQDPAFHANDEVFLKELGYEIATDNNAYLLLAETTFLFAPYLPWEVIYTFYYAAYPALLVTNGTHADGGTFQPERSIIFDHAVIKNFYGSRESTFLGAEQEKGMEKHTSWLRDMFLYWPRDFATGCALSNGNVQQSSTANERPSASGTSILIDPQRQSSSPLRRIGPGEWYQGQGFVFDADFRAILQKARLRRSEPLSSTVIDPI